MKLPLILALCLVLVGLPASAQRDTGEKSLPTISAEGCVILGSVFAGSAERRDAKQTLKQELALMYEQTKGADDPASKALIPFYKQKIQEIWQSKKAPQAIGDEFINQCFEAHGDINALKGKNI